VEARFEGGQGPEGAVVPYMEMEYIYVYICSIEILTRCTWTFFMYSLFNILAYT
jgi:hypothetical protein